MGEPGTLLTRAEATDYEETSRHADVLAFCDALAAESDLVHRSSFGVSGEGQDLVYLVISDRRCFSAERAAKLGKVIVLVEANIHAGEVEGKEMILALARDLVRGELDRTRRRDKYLAIEKILYDDAPWIWGYHRATVEVLQPYVKSYQAHPVWVRDFSYAWLDLDDQGRRVPASEVTTAPVSERPR